MEDVGGASAPASDCIAGPPEDIWVRLKVEVSGVITRRMMVAGLLAGVAAPVRAEDLGTIRPRRRPDPASVSLGLVEAARLGGVTGFVVADAVTGRVLQASRADVAVPPASVAKVVTAMFALAKLGPAHRFVTQVMAVGPIRDGVLDGDLMLAGGGDPTLDTDHLGDLAASLAATGLRRITGRLLAATGALPTIERIAADQPDHVGYNPGLSGMNLNFNRVHFEWKRAQGDWALAMDARAERFVPPVRMARIAIVPREVPLFTLAVSDGREDWTVAGAALREDGSRWLPVRQPGVYTAEVFVTLCAAQGIALPTAEIVGAPPAEARRIVEHWSAPLSDILQGMLRFSTNVTAEAVGLTASGAGSLRGSGAVMRGWAARELGMNAQFADHSGLGSTSRVTAQDVLGALLAGRGSGIAGLLRDVGVRDDKGAVIEGHPVTVRAKSGTLNFVSGLAGFISPPSGRDLCFAIFSADVARREALVIADREDPEGGVGWTRRARTLQGQLIRRWAEAYG